MVLPILQLLREIGTLQIDCRIELFQIGALRTLDLAVQCGDAGRIGRNLIPYSMSFSWKQ